MFAKMSLLLCSFTVAWWLGDYTNIFAQMWFRSAVEAYWPIVSQWARISCLYSFHFKNLKSERIPPKESNLSRTQSLIPSQCWLSFHMSLLEVFGHFILRYVSFQLSSRLPFHSVTINQPRLSSRRHHHLAMVRAPCLTLHILERQ